MIDEVMNNLSSLHDRLKQLVAIIRKGAAEWSTEEILSAAQTAGVQASQITLRRDLSQLVAQGVLQRSGKARAIRYRLHPAAQLICVIPEEDYLALPPDERRGQTRFNFEIFKLLEQVKVFSPEEYSKLQSLKQEFHRQRARLSDVLIRKEYERLTIELSWKSSAIEGNTYTLLETETLLKEGVVAEGRKAEETQMILNHKAALDFVRSNILDFKILSIRIIEQLHRILVQKLSVTPNIRKRLVAITGTTYRPLDNEFQIKEALEKTCNLVNQHSDEFTRSLLALLLISYIQPFEDGNKRTSRLLANAILLAGDGFPLSFRSVKIQDYKQAMLLFYELNYLPAFKRVFLQQAEFSVEQYFRSKNKP